MGVAHPIRPELKDKPVAQALPFAPVTDERPTLVTKADLAAVQELRAEMHGLRGDLIKWVAGLLLIHAFDVAGMTVTLSQLLA